MSTKFLASVTLVGDKVFIYEYSFKNFTKGIIFRILQIFLL